MKKSIAICLTGVLMLLLAACGAGQQNMAATGESAGAEQTAAAELKTNEETEAETVAETEAGTAAETEAGTAAETPASTEANLEEFAGEYVFYGTYLSEKFVTIEALEGTSTVLEADGTGYLNWGANNEGPISSWAIAGNSVIIKAGVSTIPGTIKDGVMMLQIGDEEASFVECYVREDADTSKMPQITAEEWAELIADTIE